MQISDERYVGKVFKHLRTELSVFCSRAFSGSLISTSEDPMRGTDGAVPDLADLFFPSGGEEKKSRDWEAEIKELRAQVEQLRRQQRGVAGPEGQGDPTRRESGLEEDWNMDVEEEVENNKKLDEQRVTGD